MTKEEIYQRVEELLLEEKGEDFVVRPDMMIANQLAEDSVEVMEFVLSLEDAFHIEISDEAIAEFETLEDVVNYIAQSLV